MNTQATISNPTAVKIGLTAAILSAAAFIIFTAAFIAIAVTQPLYTWTNLAEAVAYREAHGAFWATLAQTMMLCFGILYVLLLNSIYELTSVQHRFLMRTSLHFGLGFAILTGIHYFLQISVVRLNLLQGELAGLEQVMQANDHSAVSGINMLGWTIFFGLSSLFAAAAFPTAERLSKTIRWLLMINGVCCLIGGVAFTMEWLVVLFLAINFGMGGAVTVLTVLLTIWFGRLYKKVPAAQPHLTQGDLS